ncbi:hypothetical protein [Pseudoalteromonas luteoviolacea]|uniref:Secreted protein n=1 Tax=Pseudoalteromonas luteoviolacea S4054 TaxID=1129367 RepID=A0A0F6AFM9_9GAMM|nr:hypothetical protein [Pseudoalteromonas luteoviolacea]AOT09271.1 hypothetical protein S4054249_16075 [Pseudoalteromonas luteoviolacea]AOT14183.1 hypothetical protein S40542_16045 [Pseudoalteromonas luteoviolacea]AOT19099.1 hypothetical protein S4054_16050 [Pseudoalteromonas luteoviolacea]KKE85017.1 hypothetical protein N479_06180 [Pseudoalteromonas luteoviolacea S4054]KZN70135.1 hypothetical protein N481_01290 [Pseudoalteromonas luteoviolacea S4047-1]
MIKRIGLVALLVSMGFVSGCQSTGSADETAKKDGYRCEQVRSLGSSIPKKRCTTKEQRRQDRVNAQEQLRESQVTLSGDGAG